MSVPTIDTTPDGPPAAALTVVQDELPTDEFSVTRPGVYDIPAEVYHADPVPGGSLSSTGARKLLAPSCPSKFRYEQINGQPSKREFEIGTAVHTVALNSGPQLITIEAENWLTKKAQAQRDEARAKGAIPLLRRERAQVDGMAAALHRHPIAGSLLDPNRGTAEQSLFWVDEETGIWRRGRPDWLTHSLEERLLVVDVKSAKSAEPGEISRAIAEFGYHQQGDTYLTGARVLELGEDPAFLLAVVEKTPPYPVTVVEMDLMTLQLGRARNRRALHIYRECMKTGVWPDYEPDIAYVSLPPWAERNDTEEYL